MTTTTIDKTNTQSYPMAGQCPFGGDRVGGAFGSRPALENWYPHRLRVELLHQNGLAADPLGPDFDYAGAFRTIDLDALKNDIKQFLTSSVAWWPSDYGNYGPQMIRMAWHSAGTYRIADGRGGAGTGMQRFAPISSWWDNGNTDKSRRLLQPLKHKYGNALSWADLMVLTGNCALEIMGLPTYGFAGGRLDAWEADDATYWGPEVVEMGSVSSFDEMVNRDQRWRGKNGDADYDLENPLAASHQALIYVNPEGPYANGDPQGSANDIRVTFTRMAMNDEETVALIAGGHAFGKSHGMTPAKEIGPPPEMAPMEAMGLGWHNPNGTGAGKDTMTNGIEGSWTPDPTQWDNAYLENLFKFDWEQTKSPAGALQWTPKDPNAPKTPDAHVAGQMHPLMMMTSDIALKVDPEYRKVCEKFLNDFDAFTQAFSKAWYKLTHRDMGPKHRYLGPEVTIEDGLLWQDPIPDAAYAPVGEAEIAALKQAILATGVSVSDLAFTAFSAASTYRDSDKRGGANGGRLALAPQKDWAVNRRAAPVVEALRGVMATFNGGRGDGKQVSLADLIVLAGCAAVEKAARDAGVETRVPFTPGRADTTQDLTDIEMFEWLRPLVDGFRNYVDGGFRDMAPRLSPEEMFLDKANLLTLTAPEWVVLTGGLRALNANHDGSNQGIFTDRVGVLTTDFFRTLTDTNLVWEKVDSDGTSFVLKDRETGQARFEATRNDLVFGANAQLRNIADAYAGRDGQQRFVADFVRVWDKVMMLDRYDVKGHRRYGPMAA
ncbi:MULTISPECIES: catalase/peroxidase HPI [unclassified Methylobacterium]|uniref:catalase/peroxidase HPI n=1 Tax=unclassified Methylobacterium TaxID=2615210 RepID=UPI0011C1DEC7|nr:MULTISPECIES: catalase/peroxidase HPI [unclassified Methylobacterium]QEE38116.1 catalase/peroxidase HPI [Methylobacterium sp. WL1]TXN59962.1 catalase/peroxidase HPI [Methylobacterium sp. WL2]